MAKIGVDISHGTDTFPPSKGVYKNGKAYHEHDANSRVAERLIRKLLNAGHSVYKAQNAGQPDVPLRTRTDRYFRNNVDLIISCHANAGVSSASGYASFYWQGDNKAKKLSDLYAGEIKKQGFKLWGGSRPSIPGTWSEFHMCREPARKGIPSILLENGFMTNAGDFEWIFGSKKDEYAEKCATAAFNAVQRYLGLPIEDKKEEPKPAPKPKPTPKPKEEDDMLEKAIVINSFADFPVAESVAKNLKIPVYMRSTAEKQEVAKEVIVIGGSKNGLKGKKFTVLSGGDRFETAAKVANYLK